jgi:amino acid transporter
LAFLSPRLFKATIAFASARMTQAFKKQNISRKNTLAFRAPLSPWFQYFSSLFCAIIIVFSGFSVFINGNWSTASFFANYISESLLEETPRGIRPTR